MTRLFETRDVDVYEKIGVQVLAGLERFLTKFNVPPLYHTEPNLTMFKTRTVKSNSQVSTEQYSNYKEQSKEKALIKCKKLRQAIDYNGPLSKGDIIIDFTDYDFQMNEMVEIK